MNSYDSPTGTQKYLAYLSSPEGEIQKNILQQAIMSHITPGTRHILDVGCATGWLAHVLQKKQYEVTAIDSSPELLKVGQSQYPDLTLLLANVEAPLPFPPQGFELVILNMVLMDLQNMTRAFQNISQVLSPLGSILCTIPNPYYAYPVGVWKRGIKKLLPRSLPRLKLIPKTYNQKKNTSHSWRNGLTSTFYTLPEYIESAKKSGLYLAGLWDISSEKKSLKFNLHYQLESFPILLLVEFKKLPQ